MIDQQGKKDGSGSLLEKVQNLKPVLKSYGDIKQIVTAEYKAKATSLAGKKL